MANLPAKVPTPTTAPSSTSLLYIIDDPYGSAADNATTITSAITKGHGLSNGFLQISAGAMIVRSAVNTKTDLSLNNVDNTADASKPVSTAQQTAIDAKVENSVTSGHTTVAPSGDAVYTALALKESTANKGSAGGYASLDGGGKVPVTQLPNSIMEYQGVWNASTNTPTLANGTGNTGDVYRVSVAGSVNFGAGAISFDIGDYAIYNGTVWEKADTTDAVASVAGRTGNVTLTSTDVGLGNVTNDAQLKAADLDIDGTLAANSDTKIPSQKAIKTYVASQTGTTGLPIYSTAAGYPTL